MIKKINSKTIKLIKFYNFINYNLIYNSKAINRYKKNTYKISNDKIKDLENLRNAISTIKNCELKKKQQISFSQMGTLNQISCL